MADTLADKLRRFPPFDALGAHELAVVAAAARVESYEATDLILDAFAEHSTDVLVVLSGTVDVKEVLDHLISIGLVDADAWVAGFEIGVETQRPNAFNSAPYSGSLTFKRAPVVVWR